MHILIITPSCHGKNVGAVQRDIYTTIELLQEMGHTVSMYTISTYHRDHSVPLSVGERYGIDVRIFDAELSLRKRLKDMFVHSWTLFDGAAHVFRQLTEDGDFQSYIRERKPDIILSYCSYSWPVFEYANAEGIPSVFRSHNFESSFFWEALEPKEKWNPLNWLRYAAKYAGEKKAVMLSSAVAVLPFDQVSLYRKWKGDASVFVLTLVFLAGAMRPPNIHQGKRPIDIFYLGANYSISFHLRGVKLLIEQIAPRVLKKAPGAFRFHILGAKLPQFLVDQCRDGIVYEGYVPDLEAFLEQMDAGVFPVMTGKTMKGKVFDTLVRSFPMVISTNCLGGYDLRHGKEVLIADSTEDMISCTLSLQDPEQRKILADGARRFSLNHFTKEKIRGVFERVLNQARK